MFIKLTGAKSGQSVFILMETIQVIDRFEGDKDGKMTAVCVKDREGFIGVQETPEQIMEMIENARN